MNKPLRILILEDRPADAELVTRELRKAGFDFVAKRVATENEFLAELRDAGAATDPGRLLASRLRRIVSAGGGAKAMSGDALYLCFRLVGGGEGD